MGVFSKTYRVQIIKDFRMPGKVTARLNIRLFRKE